MSGAPNVLRHRGPQIAAALAGAEIAPVNFDVDSVRKDLRTMVEEARSRGQTLPLAERALQCFDEVSRDGLGGKDCGMLPVMWARRRARQGETR
jgi:3-hydroxyisobutyrate dehydrogenase